VVSPCQQKFTVLLTHRQDLAADLLVLHLRDRGAPLVRVNLEEYPAGAVISWIPNGQAHLRLSAASIDLSAAKSFWFRRSPPPGVSCGTSPDVARFANAEATGLLAGCWETSSGFWMNRPSHIQYAENKLVQLHLARSLGLTIPDTLVSNDPNDMRHFANQYGAVVAKAISTASVALDHERRLLFSRLIPDMHEFDDATLSAAPCILQAAVPKKADLRITVAGNRVFGTLLVSAPTSPPGIVDWRALPSAEIGYSIHTVPAEIVGLCRRMMQILGLAFGAFDFALTTSDEYVFFEVNPSGQWGWLEHFTGQPITEAIVDALLGDA